MKDKEFKARNKDMAFFKRLKPIPPTAELKGSAKPFTSSEHTRYQQKF